MASNEDQIKHVRDVILELRKDSVLFLCLAHNAYSDMDTILSEQDSVLYGLLYPQKLSDGTTKPLGVLPGLWAHIRALRTYAYWRTIDPNQVPIKDWTEVTKEDYRTFRKTIMLSHPDPLDARNGKGTATNSNNGTGPRPFSPRKEFEKGIKKDQANFPELKTISTWDNFKHEFTIEADAQTVSNVLDPTYRPSTDQDKELFDSQCKFMLSVFEKKLKPDVAKELIRTKYTQKYAAQSIWEELKTHCEMSTAAQLDMSTIMSYITSAKYGSPTFKWSGTAEAFCRHWMDKMRLLESMDGVPPLGDKWKKIMLRDAVHDHPELGRCAQSERLMRSGKAGAEFTFEEFYNILITTAQEYDKTSRATQGVSKRRVFQAESEAVDDDVSTTGDDFGMDTPVGDILVNITDTTKKRTNPVPEAARIPPDLWRQMTPKEQKGWTQITATMRASILKSRLTEKLAARAANKHAVSDSELLEQVLQCNLAGLSSVSEDDTPDTPDADDTEDTAGTTISALTHEILKPGDVRHILSTAMGKVPEKKGATTPPPAKLKANKSVTIDGNEYVLKDDSSSDRKASCATWSTDRHQATTASDDLSSAGIFHDSMSQLRRGVTSIITLCTSAIFGRCISVFRHPIRVSKHKRQRAEGALVDRGANGIVFGEDVHFYEDTGKSVNIEGIDSHQLPSVPIGTAAGVTKTHVGEVIIIMHQGANNGRGRTILAPAQLEAFGVIVDEKH